MVIRHLKGTKFVNSTILKSQFSFGSIYNYLCLSYFLSKFLMSLNETKYDYCEDFFSYERFPTREVKIGTVGIGGSNPIRIQSMTTADTMNTDLSVSEAIRMIEAGCEIVRLTAPSKKEAENLRVIKEQLNAKGIDTPLVADIHFTPNAAEVAAEYVEKVRINPGNYADKKKFEEIEYTDESYREELGRIAEKFTPLVQKCKRLGKAMRIGTNHGSLSDRILSRYGDTPKGMVESAMEFIRICESQHYYDLVISMKASNTIVMVQAYRLLVSTMKANGMNYPLHLGVTEAGDGEDGRIKSAVGIGALMEDGLGDTIRVSLTEDSEHEIPVARKLIEKFGNVEQNSDRFHEELTYSPYNYQRRKTISVNNIGDHNAPIVFADLSHRTTISQANFFGFGYSYSVQHDKWNISDLAADYVYIGSNCVDFEVPGTLRIVQNFTTWNKDKKQSHMPLLQLRELPQITAAIPFFLLLNLDSDISLESIKKYPNAILIVTTQKQHKTPVFRKFRLNLDRISISNPVILISQNLSKDTETFQLNVSSDLGIHLIDGFGDGIWIQGNQSQQLINSTAFGILQATRTRISKTEYISCPSCGRTLFDLQETTAKIRARTAHLKGVKIGIMGCIVNGPGEMADADYGYVGTGPGKINLYKERTVIRKNIAESEAVEALIDLIKEHGDWVEAN